MYGKPPAPEHLKKMQEHTAQKGKQPERPTTGQPAPETPAGPSQQPAAAPTEPQASTPTPPLPLHRASRAHTPAMTGAEREENERLRLQFTSISLETNKAIEDKRRADRDQLKKDAEEQGMTEDDALERAAPPVQVTSRITRTDEQGRRVLDHVEVSDEPAPKKEEAGENKKAEPEPTTSKQPRGVVFPLDASNARLREAQDARKAQQLSTITASAAPGPSKKTEAKPSTAAPADKGPSYYREWYHGNPDTICRMAKDEDAEVPWDTLWDLWQEYFGNQGIEPETGTPFEVRIPAKKSRFFFGAQGVAIKNIISLCLAPIRIHTEYHEEWLHIGLWFQPANRIPRMPLMQMWAILQQWSATIDQGFFFDKKMGQDIEGGTRMVADQVAHNMRNKQDSIAVQETIKARNEEEKRSRELARQRRDEELARKKEEKKQWLMESVERLLNLAPGDGDQHKTQRSEDIRILVKIKAKDQGLYGKDVGFTTSDVWAIVIDHWTKINSKQAAEGRALMYDDLS